jgi:polygalacturonase/rhamnogalacturonyl hydrolase YesR
MNLNAGVWDTDYKQVEKNIQAPEFANRSFLITKYGAKTTASARQNQQAINKAIVACSKAGGGKVVVPAGTWNTGAITLKSNVNLVVEKNATLLFAFDTDLYPLVPTRWEGLDCWNYQPCIYAYKAKNVAISGEGTIDGGATPETWWAMSGKKKFPPVDAVKERQNLGSRSRLLQQGEDGVPMDERRYGKGQGLRPQLVNFNQCENILIEGVQMLRSPFWVIHPLLSKNITVRNVKIWNEGPNGDGCDPESCENVLIEGCTFHTGDDCIAIKSGRNADGRRWNLPSKNLIIRNCVMEDGHGGVVIGSEISGGCQKVFVENCTMDSPNLERVLRIKTNSCRGGIIEDVYFRNVKVGQCQESVLKINLDYEPKEVCCRGFYPTVRNVYMDNVTCEKSQYGVMIVALDSVENVYNINVNNCRWNGVKDQAVYKTGKVRDLHFNKFYVNGKVVLDKIPYAHYSEWMTHSEMARVSHPYMLDFAKKPKWSYVMGIEMEGMLDTYLTYKDESIRQYLKEYCEEMIDADGNIKNYKLEDYNLDNIRTGKFVLRWQQLFPEEKNLKALQTLFRQLENQPRTKEGVWWHKAIYKKQVWLDGIFMGLPFYTHAAPYLNKKEKKVYNDAVKQISRTEFRTYDAATNLWKHAWDETHSIFWANKETGLSQHTWSRAQGWFAMAIVEVLDALPENYAKRQQLIDILNKVLKATVAYQDEKTGVWYDVMDVRDRKENYLESTASCMFAYCLLKAARLGYVGEDLKQAGIKAYNGIINEFIKVNEDATISLTQCCSVSGLGPETNTRRDGSFEYYMSEAIRDNDAKGIGPFIWASLEMERMFPDYNLQKTTSTTKVDPNKGIEF